MKKEERPICPYCKSKNTAIIMYGEINVSEKLEKAMENGEVIGKAVGFRSKEQILELLK